METEYILDNWREMKCTKMQKSLHHCTTPDGKMIMGDACKGECRYSHYPLNADLSKEKFKEWKLKWYDDVPKCRDFNIVRSPPPSVPASRLRMSAKIAALWQACRLCRQPKLTAWGGIIWKGMKK